MTQEQIDMFNGLCGCGQVPPLAVSQFIYEDDQYVPLGTSSPIKDSPDDLDEYGNHSRIRIAISGTPPFTLTEVTGFLTNTNFWVDTNSYQALSGNVLQFFHEGEPHPDYPGPINAASFTIEDGAGGEITWAGNIISS